MIEFLRDAGCIRTLRVERLSIAQTTAQKLRPRRHGDLRLDLFREKTPELRMVPTQFVPRAVAMLPDSRAQLLYLGDEFLSGEPFKVFVHNPQFP